MPFEQKRAIVETITTSIEVVKDEITLAYVPAIPENNKKSSRDPLPVRTFLPSVKTVKKPSRWRCERNPKSLGGHIRKKRIKNKHTMREAARLMGISILNLTEWEGRKIGPMVHHYPTIISYLGYYPFDHETESFAGKITQIRNCMGWSVRKCTSSMRLSVAAIKRWEKGKPTLIEANRNLIKRVWDHLPDATKHPV